MNDFVRLALSSPPRCLNDLERQKDASLLQSWTDVDFVAAFSLSCLCGSRNLALLGEANDEIGLMSPIRVSCPACGKERLLFDVKQHGYDGEFGHGTGYGGATAADSSLRCKACEGSHFEVCVWLTYQFYSLDEFSEIPQHEIPNYFDGFGIDGRCSSCSKYSYVGQFECA